MSALTKPAASSETKSAPVVSTTATATATATATTLAKPTPKPMAPFVPVAKRTYEERFDELEQKTADALLKVKEASLVRPSLHVCISLFESVSLG